jgi:hypothetical protein
LRVLTDVHADRGQQIIKRTRSLRSSHGVAQRQQTALTNPRLVWCAGLKQQSYLLSETSCKLRETPCPIDYLYQAPIRLTRRRRLPRHRGRRPAIHDFAVHSQGKSWMPTCVGMTEQRRSVGHCQRPLVLLACHIAGRCQAWAASFSCRSSSQHSCRCSPQHAFGRLSQHDLRGSSQHFRGSSQHPQQESQIVCATTSRRVTGACGSSLWITSSHALGSFSTA